MNIDLNKLYYYVICLIAAFALLWGTIDFVSSLTSYVMAGSPTQEQNTEDFYQKKASQERIYDALARVVISGAVFVYCRRKVS